MADAPRKKPGPKPKTPKAPVATAAVAAKPAAAKRGPKPGSTRKPRAAKPAAAAVASSGDFAESIELARAAVNSASAAARARVKSATDGAKAKVKGAKDSANGFDWKAQGEQVKVKASQAARDAADIAKTTTGSAMQNLAKLINDTASTVDGKLGPQYGDYARQAANAVAGAAKSLDEKDIEQLLGEARDFVRKSPAVAIGAAAVAGYVLMRLAKGSSEES